ncbi:MAG TPA: DeoR/GlpR family DNA-binding transcription regulator [Nocardioidaceae bacterium]|nr:DeoR/GlpR family DNA-binding transcription regulator [Nocardioidaceae bacterium]
MLAPQRRAQILAELDRRGSVRVSELVDILGVSDMTIRRDLDVLQEMGELYKVHGGATRRIERSAEEPGFLVKSSLEQGKKEAIAARAARLVEPGAAVAISAGTTTHALARHLTSVPDLTIVTNSLPVADTLHASARTDASVLLTGGLRTPSDALVGPIAISSLKSLHADLVFMGVHGMDPTTGFTTPNLLEWETNQALVACARTLVVVADSTKWGVVGLSSFAALGDADVLVTDTGLSAEARKILSDQVGQLILVDPEPPVPSP